MSVAAVAEGNDGNHQHYYTFDISIHIGEYGWHAYCDSIFN